MFSAQVVAALQSCSVRKLPTLMSYYNVKRQTNLQTVDQFFFHETTIEYTLRYQPLFFPCMARFELETSHSIMSFQTPEHRHQLLPRTRHLTISSTLLCCIIRLQHSRLTFVCLRESITALLAHTLDLSDLANGFLELLHSAKTLAFDLSRKRSQGDVPWSVVLNVILLNLLHMMITLREVHSLGILPCKISDQAERWQHHHHCPEPWIGEQALNDSDILIRDVGHGRHCRIDRHEDEP